jgi:hypothetical protein
MDNPIERRPNAIHCRRTIFCRTAFLLTTLGSTVCACMPGDTVAQQPESKKPSQNAADCYRRAAVAIKQLSESDKALIESTDQLQLRALYAPPSSWSAIELVSFSDTVPSDETAVETVARYTISQWLVAPESARALKDVTREPSRPPVNLAKKALLLETETVLPLARRLIDSSHLTAEQRRKRDKMDLIADVITIGELVERYSEERLLAQIEQSHGHYHDVGRLLDLPVDEFQPKFDKYTSDVNRTGNFFSSMGIVRCPGIERVYYDVKEMRVRWSMLQAAIDVHQSGLEALPQHKDPFGDGPFEYDCPGDAFVLSSRLIVNGTPVSMRFNARQWAALPPESRAEAVATNGSRVLGRAA